MPKTKLGKWAVGLIAVFFFSILSVILFGHSGHRPGELYLIIPAICAAISGTAAFFTAAISLFRFKDRSFLVIFISIIGFLITLIVIGEVVEGIIYRINH